MQRRIFAFIAFLFAGILLVQCTQKQESVKVDVISISIIDKETVLLNGDQVLITNLAENLKSFNKNALIKIYVPETTEMGIYQEVHKQVRLANLRNINISKEELSNIALE